jgi:hypothetical protein
MATSNRWKRSGVKTCRPLDKLACCDQEEWADGIDWQAQVADRKECLKALAEARARITERVKERHKQPPKDYEEKPARRQAQRSG